MPLSHREARLAVNAAGAGWTGGRTSLSDLSLEEQRARLGVIDREEAVARVLRTAAPEEAAGATWPTNYDWRDHNGVSPVTDQWGCGSCVSFAVVAAVESLVLIQEGFTLDLSEGDLHFCSNHGANCNGWDPDSALSELVRRGVCDETCAPYTWNPPTCTDCANRDARAVTVVGHNAFHSTDTFHVQLSLYTPLIACFDVYEDFYHYRCGIYSHIVGNYVGGHCVEVIGYDDDTGSWKCKNSWGTGWGEGGFFEIGYGQCNIDAAMWVVYGPATIPWPLRPKDQKDTKDTKDSKDQKDKDKDKDKDQKDRKDVKDRKEGKELAKEKERDTPDPVALQFSQLGQQVQELSQRVDQMGAELARGRSFIPPSERPAVGESAITDDDKPS